MLVLVSDPGSMGALSPRTGQGHVLGNVIHSSSQGKGEQSAQALMRKIGAHKHMFITESATLITDSERGGRSRGLTLRSRGLPSTQKKWPE